MGENRGFQGYVGVWILGLVLGLFLLAFFGTFFSSNLLPFAWGAGTSVTATTTVVVGNAAPSISGAVVLNNASSIVLTANATTAVSMNVTIVDNNGCADVLNGTRTLMIYRSGYTSSTCLSTASDLACYRVTEFTATSSCQNSTTIVSTTTFAVQYFANATDASSSFPSQCWQATARITDGNGATTTADSAFSEPACDLLTLTAINVTTSSINYGTLTASSTTGSSNQITTSTNAGNSSTTIQLRANSTLTSGSNSISTSSQKYATSTFTVNVGSTSTDLTASLVTVNGFFMTTPTSTTNVSDEVYWGLHVPAGTATGTFNGVNLFSSLFQP